MTGKPNDRPSEEREPGGVSVPDTETPPGSEVVDIPEPLDELAREKVKTQDRQLSRREWTRRALIIGFFVAFFLMFGVAAFAALKSSEPFGNVLKVVAYFAPFVTALGGYIAGHYFPAQDPPQDRGAGGPSDQQGL